MLKLCEESIVKLLAIIFKNCKRRKTIPNLWKKANVVSIHTKEERDLTKIIVQLCKPPSIYKPSIFSNFDCDAPKDIRAVFLCISKAFYKI